MHLTQAQTDIVKSRHRFRVLSCGRRFGKTTLAILEMIGKAISKDDVRIAYIAPTYQQARDIAWYDLKRKCHTAAKNINESRLEISILTREGGLSTIVLRGWESIETLRGQAFDFIVIDEVASMKNFWSNWQEIIRPTLTDKRGEVMFISTPRGFNHFYDLYNLEAKDKDFKSFHFTSYDNPNVPAEEIDKARQELTEDRFAQEYLADFRKTEGLVYKEFDRKIHVFKEPPRTNIYTWVGIDWGYTNPACVLEIRQDADRNLYLMSEWYKPKKTTEEIVAHAMTLKGNGYFPDPAEPDRIEVLRRAGANVREVNKDISLGIDHVREAFKNKKLFIHESCANTIAELETYSYPEKRPEKNEYEDPIKENDHAMDALRYVVFMVNANVQEQKASVYTPPTFAYRRQTIRLPGRP